MDIEASFYFIYEEFLDEDSVLTKSIDSEKARTIAVGGIVIITLNLQTEDEILGFLKHIEFIDKEVEVPPWVEEIKMLDDIEQDNIIEKNKEIIREAKGEMCVSQEILEKNNR